MIFLTALLLLTELCRALQGQLVMGWGDLRAVGEGQGCPCLLHIHLLGMGCAVLQAGALGATVFVGSQLLAQSSQNLNLVKSLKCLAEFLCEYSFNHKQATAE